MYAVWFLYAVQVRKINALRHSWRGLLPAAAVLRRYALVRMTSAMVTGKEQYEAI